MSLTEFYQHADWKNEKHSPVIKIIGEVTWDQPVKVNVSVGKEIAHPNTTEHHIAWIDVYFHPQGEKFPIHLGKVEFASHGASAKGGNTSTVYSEPEAVFSFKTEKPGTLYATSYCNIHGLWETSAPLEMK